MRNFKQEPVRVPITFSRPPIAEDVSPDVLERVRHWHLKEAGASKSKETLRDHHRHNAIARDIQSKIDQYESSHGQG